MIAKYIRQQFETQLAVISENIEYALSLVAEGSECHSVLSSALQKIGHLERAIEKAGGE